MSCAYNRDSYAMRLALRFFWSFNFLRLHHKFRCPVLGYRIDGLSLIIHFVIVGFEFWNFRDYRLENAMCGLRI